jgi:prepilin-type N-terminal cleavage/methylation domain-containing protein
MPTGPDTPRRGGFTLLELLVVLAIIGTLLSLAAPSYYHSMDKTREAVLRGNLNVLRATLDRYYADAGVYPESLNELVERRYLRGIPEDPFTGSERTWVMVPAARGKGGVADVRSGADGRGADGRAYRDW